MRLSFVCPDRIYAVKVVVRSRLRRRLFGSRLSSGAYALLFALTAHAGAAQTAADLKLVADRRAYLFQFCPLVELRGLSDWTPVNALHDRPPVGGQIHESLEIAPAADGSFANVIEDTRTANLLNWLESLPRDRTAQYQWLASGHLLDGGATQCLVLIEGEFTNSLPEMAADLREGADAMDGLGSWDWPDGWLNLFQLARPPSFYAEIDIIASDRYPAVRFAPKVVELRESALSGQTEARFLRLVFSLAFRGQAVGASALSLPPRLPVGARLVPSTLGGATTSWLSLPELVSAEGQPLEGFPDGPVSIAATLVESDVDFSTGQINMKLLGNATRRPVRTENGETIWQQLDVAPLQRFE